MASNPRHQNGNLRRKYRARLIAIGAPCAICGKPIDYTAPSDKDHPLSLAIDEIRPVSRWREFGYSSPREAAEDWSNLQATHRCCNAHKGAMTMEEMRNKEHIRQIKPVNVVSRKW